MVRFVFDETAVIAIAGLAIAFAGAVSQGSRQQVFTVDHYVRVRSSAPGMLGAPRAGGYTSRHAGKVDRLVLLAPAYNRAASSTPPATFPTDGVAFNKQSRDDFIENWDRQIGCADQYDPGVRDAVWSAMLESDPVGATWGRGVRRAPSTTVWGWNAEVAGRVRTPTLLVAGAHDKQVSPDRVRDLHADLGSAQKVLLDLACTSHNALWERNRELLFKASAEWLNHGSVTGTKAGTVRVGY